MHLRFYFLTVLLVLLCAGPVAAQSAAKIEKKAAAKVEQLDQRISESNPDLALTEVQQTVIHDMYVSLFAKMKALKGEADEKNRKKAARRAVNQSINKEILTREQRKAKRSDQPE